MREPKEPTASFLYDVGQILYEGQPALTDHDHLAIVRRGIGPKLGWQYFAGVFSYARENIQDPEVLSSAEIAIANSAIGGMTYKKSSAPVNKENRARFGAAMDVLAKHVESRASVSTPVLLDTHDLAVALEDAIEARMDTRHDYVYSRIFKDDYHVDQEKVKTRRELAAAATDCLDEVRRRLSHESIELDDPLPQLYVEQVGLAQNSKTGDRIIRTVLEMIDENTSNAVQTCLNLVSSTKNDGLKKALLDKAVAITAASSRERPVTTKTQQKKKLFGRIETILVPDEGPSIFDSRLARLDTSLSHGNLFGKLELHPDYISAVISLHPPEEQAKLWERYSNQIADRAFSNGSYIVAEIGTILKNVEQFGMVAPLEVTQKTKEKVKTRLAGSSPITSRY